MATTKQYYDFLGGQLTNACAKTIDEAVRTFEIWNIFRLSRAYQVEDVEVKVAIQEYNMESEPRYETIIRHAGNVMKNRNLFTCYCVLSRRLPKNKFQGERLLHYLNTCVGNPCRIGLERHVVQVPSPVPLMSPNPAYVPPSVRLGPMAPVVGVIPSAPPDSPPPPPPPLPLSPFPPNQLTNPVPVFIPPSPLSLGPIANGINMVQPAVVLPVSPATTVRLSVNTASLSRRDSHSIISSSASSGSAVSSFVANNAIVPVGFRESGPVFEVRAPSYDADGDVIDVPRSEPHVVTPETFGYVRPNGFGFCWWWLVWQSLSLSLVIWAWPDVVLNHWLVYLLSVLFGLLFAFPQHGHLIYYRICTPVEESLRDVRFGTDLGHNRIGLPNRRVYSRVECVVSLTCYQRWAMLGRYGVEWDNEFEWSLDRSAFDRSRLGPVLSRLVSRVGGFSWLIELGQFRWVDGYSRTTTCPSLSLVFPVRLKHHKGMATHDKVQDDIVREKMLAILPGLNLNALDPVASAALSDSLQFYRDYYTYVEIRDNILDGWNRKYF